ncbi:MAG: 3-deoxy-7-phosphoheptulonate synthase class II [Pirellulaceae bacterium]
MENEWGPTSWQTKPVAQQPSYGDAAELDAALKTLSSLPPIVTSWEIERLKEKLSRAGRGEAFILQGGDCCEQFEDCNSETIVRKLKVLLQMSLVLVYGSKREVIRIGRIGGQFAKPRSADMETRDGVSLHSYRGDLINRVPFTPEARRPDPQRLLRGYERAALTVNFIRALSEGGFADLHHPENWDLEFVRRMPRSEKYDELLSSLGEAIRFLEAIVQVSTPTLERVDFYTSHEGLHLHYEQSQTRTVPRRNAWYNLSTHMPWIGNRTRSLEGAHIEYFRGIRNPIGVKVGGDVDVQEIAEMVRVLNPEKEEGRLTLIHRFGADKIGDQLADTIAAVQRTGTPVVWSCDPMHGNTEVTNNGWKTRSFDKILSELRDSFTIHRDCGSRLGGVHLELTGENVTECIGGSGEVTESDLPMAYKSNVDPRLNYEQAMEIAFLISTEMTK